MKYRKKPVIIEAIQFKNNITEIKKFITDNGYIDYKNSNSKDCVPIVVIYTLEGKMIANEGDYIIKGIKGEFYPCKPDIFEATYELVN